MQWNEWWSSSMILKLILFFHPQNLSQARSNANVPKPLFPGKIITIDWVSEKTEAIALRSWYSRLLATAHLFRCCSYLLPKHHFQLTLHAGNFLDFSFYFHSHNHNLFLIPFYPYYCYSSKYPNFSSHNIFFCELAYTEQ